jgi:hypothetical protein
MFWEPDLTFCKAKASLGTYKAFMESLLRSEIQDPVFEVPIQDLAWIRDQFKLPILRVFVVGLKIVLSKCRSKFSF